MPIGVPSPSMRSSGPSASASRCQWRTSGHRLRHPNASRSSSIPQRASMAATPAPTAPMRGNPAAPKISAQPNRKFNRLAPTTAITIGAIRCIAVRVWRSAMNSESGISPGIAAFR